MHASRRAGLLLLVPLLLTACFDKWVDFQARRIVGLEVKTIEDDGFRLDVRCELHNPNALSATLTDVSFEAHTGKFLVGRGRFKGPLTVPAKGPFTLTAPLSVRYADLPADFPRRVAGGTLPLVLRTHFRAKTSLGSYEMTLVSRGAPAIAKALQVAVRGTFRSKTLRVEGYELDKLALRGVTLMLRLRAENAFAFPVRIRKARYRVTIDGRPLGEGELKTPLALPPKGTKRLRLPVRARHGATAFALGALFGANPRFRVRGKLWIDPIGGVSEIPIDLQADASVLAD